MIQTEMLRVKCGTYRKEHKGQVGHYEKSKIMYNWILRRRKANGTKAVFENIRANSFPKFRRDINPQIQEAVQTPSIINTKKQHRVLSG